MNEYEKDLMKLFDTHEKADKRELIKRMQGDWLPNGYGMYLVH